MDRIAQLSFNLDVDKTRAFCLKGVMRTYSTARPHTHPFHQVLFIKNGITVLADATRKMPVWGEMSAFIPAGVPHHSLVIGERVTYQSLYFRKDLMTDAGGGIRVFRISELGKALLDRLGRKNLRDVSTGLEGECLALFLKVCRTDMRRKLKHLLLPIPQDRVAQKVVDYIAANYTGEIGLRDVAAHAGYSKRHIGRRFASDVKITIFEYLRLYRAFKASLALAHERKKITALAFDCGYDSVSSFYRDFEKYFGSTPRAFRQELAKLRASSGIVA